MSYDTKLDGFGYTSSHPHRRDADGGPLLLIGCSPTMWEDLAKWDGTEVPVLAINEAGLFLMRHVRYWFSGHTNLLGKWAAVRGDQFGSRYGAQPELISCRRGPDVSSWWNFPERDFQRFMDDADVEDSAIIAACVGLCLGYDPVVLVGCPCSDWGHLYWGPQHDGEMRRLRPKIRAALQEMRDTHPIIAERLRSIQIHLCLTCCPIFFLLTLDLQFSMAFIFCDIFSSF